MTLYVNTPYRRFVVRNPMTERLSEKTEEQPRRVHFPLDVKTDNDTYVLTAFLPGVSADDLNIEIINETVTIQGEIKSDDSENDTYLLKERPSGHFRRSLKLPDPLDANKVEASLKDGVLTLIVPKAEIAKPKTIKISNN